MMNYTHPPGDRRINVRESEVDPIRDEGSNSDHGGLDADQESAVVRLRALGDP